MKAISLWQPWATLLALGHKRFETRPRNILPFCAIAIQAAKASEHFGQLRRDSVFMAEYSALGLPDFEELPRGCVVGAGQCISGSRTEVVRLKMPAREIVFGDFRPGRWAFEFANTFPANKTIPLRGQQGLFEFDGEAFERAYLRHCDGRRAASVLYGKEPRA